MKINCPSIFFTLVLFLSLPITVLAANSPSITKQPQSQNIVTGSNAVFTVSAGGSLPFSYQWSFNGINLTNSLHIGGATNSTLTVSNITTADNGNYQVLVSNSHGSIASSNATLTVLVPAAITSQPVNQSTYFGGPASFSVSTTGTAPLVYRWYFNNAPLVDGGQITGSATAVLNISGARAANIGNYKVVVTNNYGMATSQAATLNVTNSTHYVNIAGSNPAPPYLDWTTAATNIQDAVNVAYTGDLVLVTNGDYQSGAIITADGATNRVVITNSIALLSVNGPAATTIDGTGGAARPVYLADGSSLSGFTLTGGNVGNGPNPANGGGVYCVTTNVIVTNCIVVGNQCMGQGGGVYQGTVFNCTFVSNSAGGLDSAYGSGGAAGSSVLCHCFISGNSTFYYGQGGGLYNCLAFACIISNNLSPQSLGGGVFQSTLYNCLVVSNFAASYGGGAENSTLNNCTVVGNIAGVFPGGGADSSVLNNCIIYYNRALVNGNYGSVTDDETNYSASTLNNCCTTPMPTNGTGNIIALPSFVNQAGDWHLQSNSLCINAGNNSYVVTNTDLDGNPRIYGPVVDIGAYEYNASTIAITAQPSSQTLVAGQTAQFSVAADSALPLGYQWYFNGAPLSDGGRISGSGTMTLTISDIVPSDAGNYSVVVTNSSTSATSASAALGIIGAPSLTAPFTNQVTMVFSNVTMSLSVTGAPPLSCQWFQNGTPLTDGGNISGSTGPNLAIADPQMTASGQYTVIASNMWGAITNTAMLTAVPIYDWGDTSALLTPPANATNVIGITSAGQVVNADFAVRADGSVVGWGNDLYSVLEIPSNATNVLSLTAGDEQVIAIRRDGTVITWGYGGTNVPPNATNVVAAALQSYGGCLALRQDGSIITWNGATPPPINVTNAIAIGGGAWGSCLAVLQNGTVVGWGDNSYGETSPPAQATNIVAVACGDRHSLALRTDGSIVGFGLNVVGESTPPANATNVTAITAGQDVSLALHQDGTVVSFGLLGNDTPAFVTNGVAVAARYYHSVVLVPDPTVTMPPQILQQPLGAITQTNQTLILEGQACGALPIQYQWCFNDAAIAGQTNRWLLLSGIQSAQGGNYQFVATNNFGSITSLTAVVWTPPVITNPPAGTVFYGSNAVLNVGVAGTAPLSYQWYFNGTPLTDGGAISGSATATLNIANFQPTNLGNYAVTVTNLAGSATSGAAILTVLNPLITTQPQSQSVYGGATVNFSVTATGQQPLSYQWQYDGTNLQDATNSSLVLSNVVVSQSGTYSVIVANAFGTIASSNATLTVTALAISLQPQNQSVVSGATVNFSVFLYGQPPFAYQWLYNGADIPGATNSSLTLTNIIPPQAGYYSVIITNAYGMTVSANASLTVSNLFITTQPTNRITWPNGSATFKVNVAGQPPFGFDWQCNGVDVPGVWTNVLTITNVQTSQFGTYHVIVSNVWGSATSSNAVLSFSQVAVWGGANGEINLTPGLTNVIAIAAGSYPPTMDCMALRSNGTAIHWPVTNISNQYYGASNLLSIAGGGSQGPPFVVLESNGVVAQWLVDDLVEPYFGFTNLVAIASENYGPFALTTNGTMISVNPGTVGKVIYATNVVAIAQGLGFGLVLHPDGTVTSFGNNNSFGQTNVPPGLSNVVAIAAGPNDGYAVKSDGTVAAWGQNSGNLLIFAPRLTNVIAIAAGNEFALALMTNGTVVGWGQNISGDISVPPGLTNVNAIAAGASFGMALIGNGPPVLNVPLANPIMTTNGLRFSIPSQSGRVYMLQYLNSLTDTNWISLPLVPGNGHAALLTDPSPTNSQRFYRVQRW